MKIEFHGIGCLTKFYFHIAPTNPERSEGCPSPSFAAIRRDTLHLGRSRARLGCGAAGEFGASNSLLPVRALIGCIKLKNAVYAANPYKSID
jgi:hypothetical protein